MAILGRVAWFRLGRTAGGFLLAATCAVSCATSDPLADNAELDEYDDYEVSEEPSDDGGWVSTGVVDTAPAPPPAIPAADSGGTIHTVVKGDTLMGLARHYYADASKWRLILESNRDVLSDPNRVYVGQELRIP